MFVDNSLAVCGRAPDRTTGASTRLPPTLKEELLPKYNRQDFSSLYPQQQHS